jgi:hypothetical protein
VSFPAASFAERQRADLRSASYGELRSHATGGIEIKKGHRDCSTLEEIIVTRDL